MREISNNYCCIIILVKPLLKDEKTDFLMPQITKHTTVTCNFYKTNLKGIWNFFFIVNIVWRCISILSSLLMTKFDRYKLLIVKGAILFWNIKVNTLLEWTKWCHLVASVRIIKDVKFKETHNNSK